VLPDVLHQVWELPDREVPPEALGKPGQLLLRVRQAQLVNALSPAGAAASPLPVLDSSIVQVCSPPAKSLEPTHPSLTPPLDLVDPPSSPGGVSDCSGRRDDVRVRREMPIPATDKDGVSEPVEQRRREPSAQPPRSCRGVEVCSEVLRNVVPAFEDHDSSMPERSAKLLISTEGNHARPLLPLVPSRRRSVAYAHTAGRSLERGGCVGNTAQSVPSPDPSTHHLDKPQPGGCRSAGSATDAVADVGGLRGVDYLAPHCDPSR
jgi:hypothetical protein